MMFLGDNWNRDTGHWYKDPGRSRVGTLILVQPMWAISAGSRVAFILQPLFVV